ncbi:MAG: MBL fold metallo-hydrolase [Leptolyngbya sp. SIO1E4]|nr:MBL fold metallo-hydrolase [Leptolyngbya sp. SIO1E4]
MGGTAYFIVEKDSDGSSANLLIDTPACTPDTVKFLEQHGGVNQWVITHRGAIGDVKTLQEALQCEVVVQEQEAYLLPDTPNVVQYPVSYPLSPSSEAIWTPGHSPGSACVYYKGHGGVLFTGRHLLPDRSGHIVPLRFSKTFHWPRQLQSVEKLQARFSSETLSYICPAANTGFLRGRHMMVDAYAQLQAIKVPPLLNSPAML